MKLALLNLEAVVNDKIAEEERPLALYVLKQSRINKIKSNFRNTTFDTSRVSDPHFFADPDPGKIIMRIRIRILGVSEGGGWG